MTTGRPGDRAAFSRQGVFDHRGDVTCRASICEHFEKGEPRCRRGVEAVRGQDDPSGL